MTVQTKALLYQFLSFAALFILFRFLVGEYTGVSGIWIPLTAFVVSTILSPQFKAIKTTDGEKIFVKWIFLKGVKKMG
ncbi:MAG: hypothetical protein EOO48_08635 [Flavobacterium sp.]|nr:MAG: hypothetical protein EOO48_08635 [Flavobacterium sp.]